MKENQIKPLDPVLRFYHKESSQFIRWVTAKLEAMVTAHKIIEVHNDSECPEGITQNDLPVLTDEHEIWKSKKEIRAFLDELHRRLDLGRSMQSDTCHINPENPNECL